MTLSLVVLPCAKCGERHEDRALYRCETCAAVLCAEQAGLWARAYRHERVVAGRKGLCGPLARERVTVDLEAATR